jgi:hypothetical protein
MTMAATVKTLRKDKKIFWRWTVKTHPHDFKIFYELHLRKRRILISPVPGFSTHGESRFLTPLTNWADVQRDSR